MTLPRRQLRRYGATAAGALLATRSSGEGVALEVGDERGDLLVVPALADRRHRADPVVDDRLERLRARHRRVADERRADEALRLRAVALGAARGELLLAHLHRRERRLLLEPALVVGRRDDLDRLGHLRVEQPAELRTLSLVDRAGVLLADLEPGMVGLTGDRVGLRAEGRDPPAVRDVLRRDRQEDELAGGDGQLV